jgi:hypothetical protein
MLTVALLDGLEPVIVYGLRGVSPVRIFQGIAAGLIGTEAFKGGIGTMLLGMALHTFIASTVVATYWVVSRRVPLLVRHAVLCGSIYGLVVWMVMNWIVIPLSATGSGLQFPPRMPNAFGLANGIFAHLFCVGIPTGLTARAAAASHEGLRAQAPASDLTQP